MLLYAQPGRLQTAQEARAAQLTTRYELFLNAKRIIRLHPDWDDEKVAEAAGIKSLEIDLVTTARRDNDADSGRENSG